MAVSKNPETLAPDQEPSNASDLRRRPASSSSAAASPAVPDSSSRTSPSITENWTAALDGDSGAGAVGNDDLKERIGEANDLGEKKKASSGDKVGRGEVPVGFVDRPSAPVHVRVVESPLSSDTIFQQSHAGLVNLCVVILIAVNSRLIIENLMKYGLLIGSGFFFSSRLLRDWPLLICSLTLPVFPLGAYMVEKLAYRKFISEPVVVSLHVILIIATIMYPVFVILRCNSTVLSGLNLMLFASSVCLKLVSYAHANYDLRSSSNSIDKGTSYLNLYKSQGVSFKSLVYFIMAPTLCYQPSYPRTTCIRKGWVICQLVKLVIFTGVMGFIIEQYIDPIIKNSQHPLKGNVLNAMERILKLSIPTLLNILAELLHFGDREFYKDWWNAKTIEEYWRMWNMPVHKWMLRHVYLPCIRNGIPKGAAMVISFSISAIFHELCIGIPCHIFKLWAFIGIMFQVPLVILTKYLQNKFKNAMVGNMIFWFFFSIYGQPMCILLYYHDVMNRKVRTE
ncbi:diacylglycerol O-acyltransferase 1-like isoform X2 [Phoenix dactylifera]|uniref:O-acyltransferase n=1 Tax=Phoenix dactylifera TaxID=42345 RepID=A0A8B9AKB7_PHODC|nr:diacylglycerol O-acyltransferase 1-like isoform X2 [Phoenix dactylifera]